MSAIRVCSSVSAGAESSQPGRPASPRQNAHGHSQRRAVKSNTDAWPSAQSIAKVRAARSACMRTGAVGEPCGEPGKEDSVISRCAVTGPSSHAPDLRPGAGQNGRAYPPPVSLQIESLEKRFGSVVALNGLTFDVPSGEIFGFLGANGAGKTTTMRIALGVLGADRGRIVWNGDDTRGLPRRTWGYLPEERGLYPRMIVLDQLVFFASLQGIPRDLARKAALDWLRRPRISARAV